MHRRGLLIGLAASGAAGGAHAEGKPPVKLARLFPYLDKYLDLPAAERSRFTLAYYVVSGGGPAAGLKAEVIQADGRRTPFALGDDGRVLRLPTAGEIATASLKADVPAGTKLGVRLEIEATAPASREMNPRDLDLAIAQANAGIAKVAGFVGFAAPKMARAAFPGAGTGLARLADGRDLTLPLAQGAPVYDPVLHQAARMLSFARIPARVELLAKA